MKKFSTLSKLVACLIATVMIVPNVGAIPVKAADDVAINATNFPDANFREAVKQYDTDGNGILSKSEREYVMNLHCENSEIVSVEGIKYFPNIQGLWCLNNKIADWDLSGNKELVGIWCSHNSFTSLDFTGLDKLEWVYCYNCNLSSINFKNNPELAYVECNSNPNLSSLDVSNNPKLENLFCSDCGLTSLDVSHNPMLCELDAFKNNLTSLNLSKNTQLKRLDVWDNENLGNVDISGLSGLEFYNCAKNNVTSLDMSNNPQLQLLICGYNSNLTYLNVTKNPRLADLRLECDYQLTSLDLSNNHQLYNLYAFGLRDLPSVNISNNPYLIKTYTEGYYKDEPQLGNVHSYTMEFGGSEEYFEDLTHCLVVDNGKSVVTTGGQPKVIAECFIDENDGHSGSEQFATRGQAIQSLWEKAGKPSVSGSSRFTDVAGTSYEAAVRWAETYNICFGYPSICSDEFCPNELISREDFALMAHRLAGYMQLGTAFDYGRTDWFTDFYNIDYYGWGAFTWAIQFEVLGKSGNYCYPHGRMTTSELAAGVDKIFNLDGAASYSAKVNGNGTADNGKTTVKNYYSGNTGNKYTLPAKSGDSRDITPSVQNGTAGGSSGGSSGSAGGSTGGSSGSGGSSSSSGGSSGSSSKPSNEWKGGKWYNADGSQTYAPTMSWKYNGVGWWIEDTSGWYPVSSWQKVDGVWYYFDANGYMAYGEWYDGYWLDSNGAWTYPGYGTWRVNSKGWWFGDDTGWYATGWQKINGCWYYFDSNGYMLSNQYVDGYWLDGNGVCH